MEVGGWGLEVGGSRWKPSNAPRPASSTQPPASAVAALFSCAELFDNGLQRVDHFVLVDARFGEAELQPEGLRRGLVAESVVLGAAGFGPGGFLFLADDLAGGPFARDFLDQ